jgi:glutathione S-transferase
MKLFYSPASPFVRKVLVAAHERGIADRIVKLDCAAHPIQQDETIKQRNPSGKVPTLILDDGTALHDSRVICEFLDTIGEAAPLCPPSGPARWRTLVLHAAADEMLDAALLARYETALRPEALRWLEWTGGQMAKIDSTLDAFEANWLAHLHQGIDIGAITVGCALGYLDFRFPDHGWRIGRAGLAAWYGTFATRASMIATAP